MDNDVALAFAQQWLSEWNAHDLDAVLRHFADDVVFTLVFDGPLIVAGHGTYLADPTL